MKKGEIRYYNSFDDDFEVTADRNYTLPGDYKWIRTDIPSRILSAAVYALALAVGYLYCGLVLHTRIKGRKAFTGVKGGCFIYGNHTQPFGDVVLPALCIFPKRIYTVVSTANYGIPFIGRILPYLGALPVTDSIRGIRALNDAIEKRVSDGHPIVIYPEAHVWEYCSFIRPFSDVSFRYPARLDTPVFAMTVTYKRSRIFRRPIAEVYIDGPFYAKGGSVRQRSAELCKKVSDAMKARSGECDFSYIEYRPADKREKANGSTQ